jgi:hypothetical protein
LIDVYQVYLEFRSRGIARKATRRIAKRMDLSIRRNSHPIRILIEASAVGEDNRTKSRWTQALKFAFGWRQRPERLKWFFKVTGGIAGSARKYAINRRAGRRKNDSGQNNIINRQRGLGEAPNVNAAASDGLKS